jgi:outer membrane protein OmpA-like peptidoglycan-associated protein
MKAPLQNKEASIPPDPVPFFQKEGPAEVAGDEVQPFFTNTAEVVQKQTDEPKDAGDQDLSGVLTPALVPLPTFDFKDKFQEFGRFDARYTPVGPVPSEGTLEITLWTHINYENFSAERKKKDPYKNIKFTPEQLADFNWTQEEKEKFEFDFMTSVQNAWSNKFKFHLKDPAFSEYLSNVKITVLTVDDPKLAHTKINALKVPKNAPRFRAFVKGNEATLEKRDPTEPQKNKTNSFDMIRQIGAFGYDSAALTPELIDQITEVATFIKQDKDPDKWSLSFAGRASSQGSKDYNQKLANRRSESVRLELFKQMGWDDNVVANYIILNRGEENATEEAKFRRIDITVTKTANLGPEKEVEQNVAAHEAGHMFGLGDEYIRETNLMENEEAKFLGDKPSHYENVEKFIGKDEANELLISKTDSIMSVGSTVKKGHYLSFLLAINKLTDRDAEQKLWKIE